MIDKIILASKSGVRKKILEENQIKCTVEPSNVDEDSIKDGLLKENATSTIISKPNDRAEALSILEKLNGKTHQLVSSVCISKGGSMIWNYTDKASLTMKEMSEVELEVYLAKISDEALYAYNVYQIEGEGRSLFSKVEGDKDTIMGLPVKKIKEYLNNYK